MLVKQYQKTDQLDRALNNTNVRRQIEQQNSAVLFEANILEEKNELVASEMQVLFSPYYHLKLSSKKERNSNENLLWRKSSLPLSSKTLMDKLCGNRTSENRYHIKHMQVCNERQLWLLGTNS